MNLDLDAEKHIFFKFKDSIKGTPSQTVYLNDAQKDNMMLNFDRVLYCISYEWSSVDILLNCFTPHNGSTPQGDIQ